jgi:hypothetical protein
VLLDRPPFVVQTPAAPSGNASLPAAVRRVLSTRLKLCLNGQTNAEQFSVELGSIGLYESVRVQRVEPRFVPHSVATPVVVRGLNLPDTGADQALFWFAGPLYAASGCAYVNASALSCLSPVLADDAVALTTQQSVTFTLDKQHVQTAQLGAYLLFYRLMVQSTTSRLVHVNGTEQYALSVDHSCP